MNPTPELPVDQVLESAEQAWGLPMQAAGCRVCGQAHLVQADQIGTRCPNCGRGKLEAQPVRLRREPPERLVPFSKNPTDLRPKLENFVKEVWLSPPDFTLDNLHKRLRPLYWPIWLVDSELVGAWQAEMGYDYQVKSSQESFHGSGWQSQDVIETRQQWQPRAGTLRRHYDNRIVEALTDHAILTRMLGKYALERSAAYTSASLGSAAVRIPDLSPESAWPQAQDVLDYAAQLDCQQAAGAQHVRRFSIEASYNQLNWTQMLLPLWCSYYTDEDGQVHTVLINGQSGQISGVRKASQRQGWVWAGILAGIAAALAVVGALLLLVLPPLAGILFFLALLVATSTLAPLIWPWQWNRNQTTERIVTK